MAKPDSSDYAPYYEGYISLVAENNVNQALLNSLKNDLDFLKIIPQAKVNSTYADGKWTLKEVVKHIIDCERVFAYRALTFARRDKTELPGFDHNFYVKTSEVINQSYTEMIDEFEAVRVSTIHLFKSLSQFQLDATGVANKNKVTVNALGFIIVGHSLHHLNIINQKYL